MSPRGVPGALSRSLSMATRAGATAVLLAVVAAAWVVAPAAAQGDRGAFSDDDGAYYEVPLNVLEVRGVLAGTQCAPGRICPDEPISRATVAVWLGRAVTGTEPAAANGSRFADVDAEDWQASHIERFADLGVTQGCAANLPLFCPDRVVTRAEMAAFLVRAFDLPAAGSAGFADTDGHFFEDSIDALAAAGVTAGCGADTLRYCPDQPVTRGQMATFIARALGLVVEPAVRSDEKVLEPVARLTGRLAPKSIVASGTGLYFAQNVMYQHTISVFDAAKQLVATVQDSVDLRAFGYDVPGETYRGAPVEAAFTSDGSYAFVSNYRMYGAGYDPRAGGDVCEKDRGERSFVYRIDTETLAIDAVYEAGPVPKFMAVTPDDRLLLVSNWCGYDVSVIDLESHETLTEVEVGRYPRGIAVTGDSTTAYVAVMGSTDIAVIDLPAVTAGVTHLGSDGEPAGLSYLEGVGDQPRHLVLSPDDEVLYVTLNGANVVVALDADSGQELLRARTGTQPRSMDISDDGTALYVVNYRSDTFTKLRARDLSILQTLDTAPRPIGITYDSFNDEVWVSAYSGVIHVYAEQEPAQPPCETADCEAGPGAGSPAAAEPEPEPAPAASETVTPLVKPYGDGPLPYEQALDAANRLAPELALPVDCGPPPVDKPGRLPNAARDYRYGTHQGVDFFCPRGHPTKAALDGRVVVAVGNYQDASASELDDLLAVARALRATPPYTLLTLYGNYVVVDHGIIDSVGHVVSIYAHHDALDPAVRIGQQVRAGDPLGRVGNTGTTFAAAGSTTQGLQLHWELHINGHYLGEGLSNSETRAVYTALFKHADQ